MSLVDAGEQRVLDLFRESWEARTVRPDRPVVVVDVGANRGDYAAAVLDRFSAPRIVCFEPQATAAEALAERLGSRVEVVPVALAGRNGRGVLRSTHNDACVLATLTDRDRDTYDPSVKLDQEEDVEVRTLDTIANELSLYRADLLKLDAEGHELEILEGGRWFIEGDVPLVTFEFNACAPAAGVSFKDLWDLLIPRYELYRVDVSGAITPVRTYDPADEDPTHRNYLAVARDCEWFRRPE